MRRLINYNFFCETSFCATMRRHWRRSIQIFVHYSAIKFVTVYCSFAVVCFTSYAQQNIREDILLNSDWTYCTGINNLKSFPPNTSDYYFTKVNVPHNADAYDGYRRLLHGNKHGDIWYRKIISIVQPNKNRRNFLYFEGVGSYAKIYLN